MLVYKFVIETENRNVKNMQIIEWENIKDFSSFFDDAQKEFLANGTAITIGSFDGPHVGHKMLFENVLHYATEKKMIAGVVTFRQSTAAFQNGKNYYGDIASLSQRLCAFEKCGMEFAIVIDFSSDFAKMNGKDFLSFLHSFCRMQFLCEGTDFRCGFGGKTSASEIKKIACDLDFECKFFEPVFDGGKICSSRIRACIREQNFLEAEKLLGKKFEIDARNFLWHIEKKDGTDFGCIKISDCKQVLPESGNFSVRLKMQNEILQARLKIDEQRLKIFAENEKLDFDKLSEIEFIEF